MEVWNRLAGIATNLGLKKTGLTRLRHEVRTCEYEDVRVLWDMLNKAEAEMAGSSPATAKKGEKRRKRKKKNVCSSFFEWACRRIY